MKTLRIATPSFYFTILLFDLYSQALDPSLGLNPSNLNRNGIAFGALPAFKEPLEPNTPDHINAQLHRPISVVSHTSHSSLLSLSIHSSLFFQLHSFDSYPLTFKHSLTTFSLSLSFFRWVIIYT